MEEFDFITGGQTYHGQMAKAAQPVAKLCVIHGIGEHFGRYRSFAEHLAGRGISVYGVDLPGHGLSPGRRGHLGSRKELNEGFVDSFVKLTDTDGQPVPIYLMGHSMGGNIVLSYRAGMADSKVSGYVISSPWIELVKPPSPLYKAAGYVLAAIWPTFLMSAGLSPENLSERAASGGEETDELCHSRISAVTGIDCFKYAKRFMKAAGNGGKPVYLIHSVSDRICSAEGSRAFAKSAGGVCTYREYAGMGHEMLREEKWLEVAGGIADWVLMEAGRGAK